MKALMQLFMTLIVGVIPKSILYRVLNATVPVLVRIKGKRINHVVSYGVGVASPRYRDYVMRRFGNSYVDCCHVPFGYKMYVPVTDNHYTYRKFGLYHPGVLLRTMERFCRPGSAVCELGTHLGEMTLFLARLVGSSGKVYAFEIDNEFCRILKMSLDANNFAHVKLENKAVGKPGVISVGDGYCDFPTMMANFPELNYASSLGTQFFTEEEENWNKAEIPKVKHISVERTDLYEYFRTLGCPVDVFFMDIEGCEVFAIPMILKLAQHYRYRPKIVFEVHHNTYSSEQAWAIRNALQAVGYSMSSPDGRHVVCE